MWFFFLNHFISCSTGTRVLCNLPQKSTSLLSSPCTPPLSLVIGESAKRASPHGWAAGRPDSPPCPAPEGDPDIPGEAKSMPSNIPALKLQLPSVWEPALFKAIRAKGPAEQEGAGRAAGHASSPSLPKMLRAGPTLPGCWHRFSYCRQRGFSSRKKEKQRQCPDNKWEGAPGAQHTLVCPRPEAEPPALSLCCSSAPVPAPLPCPVPKSGWSRAPGGERSAPGTQRGCGRCL